MKKISSHQYIPTYGQFRNSKRESAHHVKIMQRNHHRVTQNYKLSFSRHSTDERAPGQHDRRSTPKHQLTKYEPHKNAMFRQNQSMLRQWHAVDHFLPRVAVEDRRNCGGFESESFSLAVGLLECLVHKVIR